MKYYKKGEQVEEKLKMLNVGEETHKQIKTQAAKAGMSIKDYIQYLADKDK